MASATLLLGSPQVAGPSEVLVKSLGALVTYGLCPESS